MSSLKLQGATSGEITLTVPSVAGTNTLTLPAASGNILTDGAVANNGIYLGGTSAANLLDDYEEGTWTPLVTFSGGSTAVAYNYNDGSYTKVGNLVTVGFSISLSSKGSSTGNLRVEGLPFTSPDNRVWMQAHPYAVNMSFASNLSFYPSQNSNFLIFVEFTDTGAPSFINNNDCTNTTALRGSLTYFTEA